MHVLSWHKKSVASEQISAVSPTMENKNKNSTSSILSLQLKTVSCYIDFPFFIKLVSVDNCPVLTSKQPPIFPSTSSYPSYHIAPAFSLNKCALKQLKRMYSTHTDRCQQPPSYYPANINPFTLIWDLPLLTRAVCMPVGLEISLGALRSQQCVYNSEQ